MMPIRYRNRNPLDQLRNEMDRLVTGFMSGVPDGPWFTGPRGQPAVNVWEEPDALYVEAELPGVSANEIEISVVGEELALKVERSDSQPAGVVYHRRERPVGAFTRMVRLPVEVNAEGVQADLKNGVLQIKLPKAEKSLPRKINVNVS